MGETIPLHVSCLAPDVAARRAQTPEWSDSGLWARQRLWRLSFGTAAGTWRLGPRVAFFLFTFQVRGRGVKPWQLPGRLCSTGQRRGWRLWDLVLNQEELDAISKI